MKIINPIHIFTILLLLSFSNMSSSTESLGQATNAAVEFLEQTLLENDTNAAYSYFHDELKQKLPIEALQHMIDMSKRVPEIKNIEAVKYTSGFDDDQYLIYLMSTRVDGEQPFVALLMEGNKQQGYKVNGIETLDTSRTIDNLPGNLFKSEK